MSDQRARKDLKKSPGFNVIPLDELKAELKAQVGLINFIKSKKTNQHLTIFEREDKTVLVKDNSEIPFDVMNERWEKSFGVK